MEKLAHKILSQVFPDRNAKALFLCPSDSIDRLTTEISSTSANFGLFLALDARGLSDEGIRQAARRLVSKGLVYLCVWGPDCERVHDLFDDVEAEKEPTSSPKIGIDDVIMTTWHSDESLSEALWFFMHCAFPAQDFEATCKDWIMAPIENADWEQTIRSYVTQT